MLVHTSLPMTTRQAREWVRQIEDGQCDLNPPYQRGTVWSTDQRRGLMKSFLLGLPVPAVILSNRGHFGWADPDIPNPVMTGEGPMHAVIDGKQRFETALAWHRGELAIPAEWLDPQFIAEGHTGDMVTRADLTVPGQRLTDHRMIVQIAEAKVATVKDEAAIYLLINGAGTAQTGDDLARAAAVANR